MVTGYKIYVDGVDITSYGTPAGYTVGYSLQDGGQGGLMLDGSERVDELSQRPVVTFPCMPLSEGRLNELYSLVVSEPIHSLNFYDPAQGQRTMRVRRSVSSPRYRGRGADGNLYWSGITITFRGIE